MAEVKDKVVTVESLSALHEYNKETYMTNTDPVGTGSFSMNRKTDSVVGKCSSTFGTGCVASSATSHAEGTNTIASGAMSHAEGGGSQAIGFISHAEGNCTQAIGDSSHSEGQGTVAFGKISHAEGYNTIADGECQHVQGRCNIEDTLGRYAHIVGNGEGDGNSTIRSNAHTVDWNGNGWFSGDVYVGGTSQDDASKLVKTTNVVSIEYGDTLPEAGTVGRVFFKKLNA